MGIGIRHLNLYYLFKIIPIIAVLSPSFNLDDFLALYPALKYASLIGIRYCALTNFKDLIRRDTGLIWEKEKNRRNY
jgi:hypothetical protein